MNAPTIEEIKVMQMGDHLDALVARDVMGWGELSFFEANDNDRPKKSLGFPPELAGKERLTIGHRYWETNGALEVPRWSLRIAWAWKVLELMYEDTRHAKVLRVFKWDEEQSRAAGFTGPWTCQYGESATFMFADTAPLAICRAALAWKASTEYRALGSKRLRSNQ